MSKGVTLKTVIKHLETFAPLSYSEKWDNVGLLLEPYNQGNIEKILVTNDLTERVMQEAVDKNVNMIVTYHPLIFAPLKRITQDSWKERIVSSCLGKSIAVYSPHTSWYKTFGGINDWLSSALPCKNIKPLKPHDDSVDQKAGLGRTFSTKISLEDAIEAVEKHIGLNVRVAMGVKHTLKTPIAAVAVCAGSGGSLLSGIKADLYITGEMTHHEVLDANHNNVTVILCNHTNSERGFVKTFKPKLDEMLNGSCEVIVSETDEDPIKAFVKAN